MTAVLVVVEESGRRQRFLGILSGRGYKSEGASDLAEAAKKMAEKELDPWVVILGKGQIPPLSASHLLTNISEKLKESIFILLVADWQEEVPRGFWKLAQPVSDDDLADTVEKAIKKSGNIRQGDHRPRRQMRV